jgi:hypothetical protein
MLNIELNSDVELKDYRYLGERAEAIGQRLDSARLALSESRSKWAKRHWQFVIDQLLIQWRMLPALHDGAAQVQIIPRWTVEYDFYEEHDGITYSKLDKMFDGSPDLTGSWERAREARLARCQ